MTEADVLRFISFIVLFWTGAVVAIFIAIGANAGLKAVLKRWRHRASDD